ncbi:hypothetical protein [Streptomyces sp. YIM 103828]|uniref:helix-turn-helix domain-containing protein n=1 Tax=Streptomyces sp. YIM 103828 TaxID=3158968 RepID=UPI0032D92E45
MTTVHRWTGLEARALRLALRMSVRTFAAHLGVGTRTVSKWEKLLSTTEPRQDTQAILDTALARAELSVHLRFETSLHEAGRADGRCARPVAFSGPRTWEYETWADDLDRSVVALSRQNFPFAQDLLRRWLVRFPPPGLDEKGLYLHARTTSLLGDVQRDQGALLGPLSARRSYQDARTVFGRLGVARRVAQLDLSLAVLMEMSGQLEAAARQYEALAVDDRLSRRDRARARLWVGTALSKEGDHEYATRAMLAAVREFDDLSEPEDWAVTHQKLALAHRGAGGLTAARRCIDVARTAGLADSPLQRVRLNTAHGHILLSDPGTLDDGLDVLAKTAQVAAEYGLSHQRRSIEIIRSRHATSGGAMRPVRR